MKQPVRHNPQAIARPYDTSDDAAERRAAVQRQRAERLAQLEVKSQTAAARRRFDRIANKPELMQRLAREQSFRCALCFRPFRMVRGCAVGATFDHIIPVAHWPGGADRVSNLQSAHHECNQLRGARTMLDFRAALASGELRLPDLP